MISLRQILGLPVVLPKTIALSEGEDPRVVEGAIVAHSTGIAKIILIGDHRGIEAELSRQGFGDKNAIDIHNPVTSDLLDQLAEGLYEHRKHKSMSRKAAEKAVRTPLVYAAMLVKEGIADGTVGGAVATTSDTVRSAFKVIGKAHDTQLISSFFLMLPNTNLHPDASPVAFADCALTVNPDAAGLAEIAKASAASLIALTGQEPRVAMLSFSTHGSATHPQVTKVIEATQIVRETSPSLIIDGELQFDAAFDPSVAAKKAPGSALQGNANVFVFPNLDAGNIGYKIAQRIGGMTAIGPILQGLDKPANDLSRGCSAQDVLHMIEITVAQASH